MKARNAIAIAALGIIFSGCLFAGEDERAYIHGRSASDENVPPFSGAVLANNTLYVSGSLGLVDGKIPEDPADEARAVMNAIKAEVEAAGMTMDDLVFVQIFCSDVAHYGAFNAVYRTYFTKEYPARAFLGSGALLFNARFEVLATAVRREAD
ncbi:MAG: Rid family hydrolase [Proteobacteria bacterium]|nr:Rid family hydrolase [Pseudomonadota bacterium]